MSQTAGKSVVEATEDEIDAIIADSAAILARRSGLFFTT
jgi:hypothetical protein